MSKDDAVYNIELYDRKPKPGLQVWAFFIVSAMAFPRNTISPFQEAMDTNLPLPQ